MAERIALAELARVLAGEAQRPLAQSAGGGTAAAGDFLARLHAWRETFEAAPGARVALYLEDAFAFAAALFGAWHAGRQVVLPADVLPATLEKLAARVDLRAGEMPGALACVALASAQPMLPPLDDASERLVMFTSGSSGDPVAIGKTLRQLDSEIGALEAAFGERMGDALIQGTVSQQHIYGLLFRVLWPLSARRIFAARRLGYPEQIADAADGRRFVLASSPAMLKRVPEAMDATGLRSDLALVFSSGGPLPQEAAVALRARWGQAPIEVFGSTETGGIAWRQQGSSWRPLPGVDVRIEAQQLEVRSAHLPDPTWYRTSDRAQADAGGFQLLGRADRLVKLEERRVSLAAIERALQASEWVAQARVLVRESQRLRIAAVIVPSAAGAAVLAELGRKPLLDRLVSGLRGQVDPIAMPKQWRIVDTLPEDSQGKTTQGQLERLFRRAMPEPRWIHRGDTVAGLAVRVDPDLLVLDGHFPRAPIVPGVALVDWAIAWGREAFAIERGFLRMDSMKFQRVVTPGTELGLELTWQAQGGALGFRFESVHGVHAGGRIFFATAGAHP